MSKKASTAIAWFAHSSKYSQEVGVKTLIPLHGVEAFGRFLLLKEMLCGAEDRSFDTAQKHAYVILGETLRCPADEAKRFIFELIDLSLIVGDKGKISCPELSTQMTSYSERQDIASKAGKASVESRRKVKAEKERKRQERMVRDQERRLAKEAEKSKPQVKEKPVPEPAPLLFESPAPPEKPEPIDPFEGLDEVQIANWNAFMAWIKKNDYKQVMSMAKPLTPKQYNALLANPKYTTKLIKETFLAMENKKTLKKDYTSANLTIQRWLNLAIERSN